MKRNNYIGYHIVSKILRFAGYVWFNEKVYNKEYIPKEGKCILAGNHLSNLDAYLLFASTKRPIHFLGKIELFNGKFAWFFKMMHLIPVDRKNKNNKTKEETIKILNEEKVIGIFPEGTYHSKGKKTKDVDLLPFKPGAISFSEKTDAPIIPFAMKSTFKFRCHPIIMFGKPIYANKLKNVDKVKYLEDKVRELMKEIEKL